MPFRPLPTTQSLLLTSLLATAATIHLPPLSGPFNVGFTQHIFNHSTPHDPTPGPATFYLTSIYYPTRSAPSNSTTVSYIDPTSASI